MRVLLLQLDGKLPNVALMRIATHHRGDQVTFRFAGNERSIEPHFGDRFDRVYASLIFDRTSPLAERLKTIYPDAIIGGTGWSKKLRIEHLGITTKIQDYSIYPRFNNSIGYSQRGCRFKCSHCVVPDVEGDVWEENSIADIWRGGLYPRNIHLLDNDFFGQENWRARVEEIISGDFKVCFNQGINARMLNDETAAALGAMKCRDDQFKTKRIYTAWDNRGDEKRLFRGLESLTSNGFTPDQIMVYILIGYDHRTKTGRPFLIDDDFYRHARLREFGCRPYPMPYVRTPELVGFQRWVIGAYDKRISWQRWKAARYQPNNLGVETGQMPLLTL